MDDRIARLQGEAFLRGHGSPDFVVYSNKLKAWEPPHDAEMLDPTMKMRILDTVKREMAEKGMTVAIE
jgi:hypothetical protein